ncbi:MAG: hypothetical protein GX777_03205 [Fastidiosipila sp.]|nr:hypothetical protein [Fastidiosipila sp.]
MSLEKYNQKRDFEKTSEPAAKRKSSGDELIFVVQLHDASSLHYDFRLEWDGVLLSWAVPKGPSFNTKDKRLAIHVEDHPYDYRTFEGTIPQDEYGGGTVMIWDRGIWEPDDEDVDKNLSEGMIKFVLKGERLQGNWVLVRMKSKQEEEDKNWLLIKEKDDYAREDTGIENFETSVVTGRTLEEIAKINENEIAQTKTVSEEKNSASDRIKKNFVIGAYTTSGKSKTGLSSLLLGLKENDNLQYFGRAGTGISDEAAAELLSKFKNIKRKTSPFSEDIEKRSDETITYLTPELVAEIKYSEITDNGLLQQASFEGLRNSESTAKYGDIKLSSPNKLIFTDDDISKKDIADYYWNIKDEILAYIADRPLTLIRCTDGIGEKCFFQKNMFQDIPGMDTFPFKRNDGEKAEAMVIRDESALMGAVQMGAVEFHSWGSRTETMEKPDLMVFDLDPDAGLEIEFLREGASDLRKLLQEKDLKSYLRTSGGKGYHLVVPLKPVAGWERAHAFAEMIAKTMEEKWPDRYTNEMRKDKREGRIFVDWLRNSRGATSVSNFSLRSRQGAPISWPIRWSDLDEIEPGQVTLKNYEDYRDTLQGWADFFRQKQTLE